MMEHIIVERDTDPAPSHDSRQIGSAVGDFYAPWVKTCHSVNIGEARGNDKLALSKPG
jgi:hypothetical protein